MVLITTILPQSADCRTVSLITINQENNQHLSVLRPCSGTAQELGCIFGFVCYNLPLGEVLNRYRKKEGELDDHIFKRMFMIPLFVSSQSVYF